jgi:hypothetical protein
MRIARLFPHFDTRIGVLRAENAIQVKSISFQRSITS